MQRGTKQLAKTKFSHNSAKLLFFQTFFIKTQIYYITQFQTNDVYIGLANAQFKIQWSGQVKEKISCVCYCEKANILYAGTEIGIIATIQLSRSEMKQPGQIANPQNGANILAIFSYYNQTDTVVELITVIEGVLNKYKDNKHELSIQFPFKIIRAIQNKTVMNIQDVAMILFKQNGRHPYLFSAQFLIKICRSRANKQDLQSLISQYQKSIPSQKDQQIPTQRISAISLSNCHNIFAIAYQKIVTIWVIKRVGKWMICLPDFKFEEQEKLISLDLVETKLTVCSEKGITTYDIQKRNKISKGLVIKNGEYNQAKWSQLSKSVIFGVVGGKKGKITYCPLSKITYDEDQSTKIK